MKKIKVGIFGDSFGAVIGPWPYKFSYVGPGWPELLDKHPNYTLENFCEGGASFWYSYNQFLANYHRFDKIIFLITAPGRITVNIPGFSELAPSFKHFPTYDSVANWRKIASNRIENPVVLAQVKKHIDAVENYFLYVKNDEYDEYIQNLLIKKLKNLKSDIIFIPCFSKSIDPLTTTPLCEIGYKELHHFFGDIPLQRIYKDLATDNLTDARKCHMTEENNYILYNEYILKFLEGSPVKIDIDKFQIPTKSLNYYWGNTND